MNTLRRITSRANPVFKALSALASDPRAPRREGRALADGIHLVADCFAHGITVQQVLVSESGQQNPQIAALLANAGEIEYLLLSDTLFREISGVATPTGIAAVIDIPPAPQGTIAGDAVLLDAVQDAGNVGTILRTAAAAGVRDVVLGPGCAGAWTPRVLRAGQGAHFNLRIREQTDLLTAQNACRGMSIATVACEGVSLYTLDLGQPIVWLFGNEGAGLSAELIAAAQQRVTIPLAASTESLNVAAAAAVCLFEAVRQRQ
ncbi:MAG: RNA methyltransferase [Rugosibacter sp.]|nr:RNA methyltransferase [Rugosibacter sp.]